jgi:nucleotide-binding universal stress UspA family protein
MERILVGMDGSESAADALRWAVEEAARHGATVSALLAWGYLEQYHEHGGPTFDPTYGEEDVRAALRAFVRAAVGDDPAAPVEEDIVCDLPARALLDRAKDADLVVVGARGLGGFRGLLVGSVSQHVLHHSPVPVAVIRAAARPDHDGPQRVVVGVDGSDTSQRALEWAVAEAASRAAELEVVHSYTVPYLGGYPYAEPLDPAPFQEAASKLLDDALDATDTSALPGAPIRTLSLGGARPGLLDASQDADLVVVGARGVGGFRGMLLGSVSHAVAQHATCPVVVVPPAEAEAEHS